MIEGTMLTALQRRRAAVVLPLAVGAFMALWFGAQDGALAAALCAGGAIALALLPAVRARFRSLKDPTARRLKWMAAEVTGVQVRRYVRVPNAARPLRVHLEGRADGKPIAAQTDGIAVCPPDPALPDEKPLQAPYRFRIDGGNLVVDGGDGTPNADVDLRDDHTLHVPDALHDVCVLDQFVVLVATTHPVAERERTDRREWSMARDDLDRRLRLGGR
jgi:hypothetical protein